MPLPFPPPNFYQTQLAVLAVFCLAAVLLERYVDHQKKKNAGDVHDTNDVEERRPLNASASQATKTAFSVLRRSYLIVYGIVMGERRHLWHSLSELTRRPRCGLAAGALRLFPVPGAIRLLRTDRRVPLRHWFHSRRPKWTFYWRVGGQIVSALITLQCRGASS